MLGQASLPASSNGSFLLFFSFSIKNSYSCKSFVMLQLLFPAQNPAQRHLYIHYLQQAFYAVQYFVAVGRNNQSKRDYEGHTMVGSRLIWAILSFPKCTETVVHAHSCALLHRNMAVTARSQNQCFAADNCSPSA